MLAAKQLLPNYCRTQTGMMYRQAIHHRLRTKRCKVGRDLEGKVQHLYNYAWFAGFAVAFFAYRDS